MKKYGNKTIPIHVSNNPDDYEVHVSFQDMIFVYCPSVGESGTIDSIENGI